MRLDAVRPDVAVRGLALLAGAGAIVMYLCVFPHGSINNDEGVYVLQARTLASGHLFLPADAVQQPWFFGVHSGSYVPKYLPGLAAIYAASIFLVGDIWPVLGLVAALLPLSCYALAKDVGLSERKALVAAAIIALSPLSVFQVGLALSYVPFAVAMAYAWLLVLQLLRGEDVPWKAPALGFLVVWCASLRPYDTLLLLLPFGWALCRRRTVRRARLAGLALCGGAPLALLFGFYDRAATGSFFRAPFSLFEPSDKLGYGIRRISPEGPATWFGPRQAFQGEISHFLVAPLTWFGLGLIVLPAVVLLAFGRGKKNAQLTLLLWSIAVFLAGYFIFWGPYNASYLWGGPRTIGPFYALALLVPAAIVAVSFLSATFSRRRSLAVVAVVGAVAVALNGVQFVGALRRNLQDGRRTSSLVAAIKKVPKDQTLLVQTSPVYLGHPVSALSSASDLANQVLAPRLDPTALEASRPVTLLMVDPGFYETTASSSFTIEPQRRISAHDLRLSVSGRVASDLVTVRSGDEVANCVGSAKVEVSVSTSQPQISCEHAALPVKKQPWALGACPTARCIEITVFDRAGGEKPRARSVRRLVIGQRDGQLVAYVDQRKLVGSRFASIMGS